MVTMVRSSKEPCGSSQAEGGLECINRTRIATRAFHGIDAISRPEAMGAFKESKTRSEAYQV